MLNTRNIHRFATRLFVGLLVICILVSIVAVVVARNEETKSDALATDTTTEPMPAETVEYEPEDTTAPVELEQPLLFTEIEYVQYSDVLDMQKLFDDTQAAIHLIWNELECPLYSASARLAMEQEIDRLNVIFEALKYDINSFYLWEAKAAEYPYATRLWQYLKDMGYSDVACAGILGNAMAECGGNTLRLNPFSGTGEDFYGIFQWSKKYHPWAYGLSFEDQLEYFKNSVYTTFKNWGYKYADGFTHDDFNALESPRDAALAFAKIYERCADWTYERRLNFSEVAYQYFVLDFMETDYSFE